MTESKSRKKIPVTSTGEEVWTDDYQAVGPTHSACLPAKCSLSFTEKSFYKSEYNVHRQAIPIMFCAAVIISVLGSDKTFTRKSQTRR